MIHGEGEAIAIVGYFVQYMSSMEVKILMDYDAHTAWQWSTAIYGDLYPESVRILRYHHQMPRKWSCF